MKLKKEIALNKLFNFFVVLGIIFIIFAEPLLSGNLYIEAALFGGVGIITLILTVLFTPYCYCFDKEGVSLCYVFLPVERYLWKNIKAIDVTICHMGRPTSIFTLFFGSVFSVDALPVGTSRFYMKGYIRKSFRTKRLLNKYWDGTITGYLFEDVANWIKKKKAKKNAEIKEHFTDEVAPMEREIRQKAKEKLGYFISGAKQYDLDVKIKFIYVDNGLKEWRSRPKNCDHTYKLIIEMRRMNDTESEQMVDFEIDLLYVRLGRTHLRGVYNANMEKEIQLLTSDVLDTISKEGLSFYFED